MSSSSSREMPRAYNPKEVEEPLNRFWLEKGYFTPEVNRSRKPFTVIMPLPNVTGDLHLGHALTMFMQDILTRWHRMMGEEALWLPGKDHAGIATQVVVERQLAQEGKSRQEMGREKFLERMWDWVDQSGSNIEVQLKRMGASCDWSRLCFTLDPGPSRAVRTAFVNLYEKGLIYRGERIINWCIRCATALSDLEVEYEEEDGSLYYVKYPMEKGDGHITVATTRPETMFGDTGVAVHSEDPRYQVMLGRNVMLPLTDRAIPVVGDEAIDPEFGTGVLKVTPGHDTVDFEVGQRHNLPIVTAVDERGFLTEAAGEFKGQERFEARRNTAEELERQGFLVKTEPLRHSLGHCQRCATVVEPLVSKQWFVRIQPLAEPGHRVGKERAGSHSAGSVFRGCISTGWRTFATGASAASYGGGIAFRSGIATGATCLRCRWRTRRNAVTAVPRALRKTRTCWTRGSVRGCGLIRLWAGRTRRRTWTISIPRR